LIELGAYADTDAVDIKTSPAPAPVSPFQAVLNAMNAQNAAADAIGEAAAALAEEEQVRIVFF